MRHLVTRGGLAVLLASGLLAASSAVFAEAISITQAQWQAATRTLVISGAATTNRSVTLKNAVSGTTISSSVSPSNNRWSRNISNPSPVPCRVRAEQSGTGAPPVELDVAGRPETCAPVTRAQSEHSTIASYTGPETCLACHEAEARQVHGSVHYQQYAIAPNVTNINPPGTPANQLRNAGEGPAGRPLAVSPLDPPQPINSLMAINTYCGTHENSPRFTCVGCHVGNGRYQRTPAELAQLDTTGNKLQVTEELANIDCLMCHQQAYKRFPDWTATTQGFDNLTLENVCTDAAGTLLDPTKPENIGKCVTGPPVVRTDLQGIPKLRDGTLDFAFRPSTNVATDPFFLQATAGTAAPRMTIPSLQAAKEVHRTTRQSCLNCHARAAAADGAKRGDLSTANNNPPVALDVHMSSATGGAGLSCSSCHNANGADGNTLHRVKGRGVDLRANDVSQRFTCDNAGCHTSTPHGNVSNGTQLNRHTTKVACQTCHIPTYAKVVTNADGSTSGIPTETVRNWEDAHVSQSACNGRGGWLPEEVKGSNLRPTYAWFNGTSEVYYLGEKLAALDNGGRTKLLDVSMAAVLRFAPNTPSYVLGKPNGSVGDANAKIYPMKEHWGKLAKNDATGDIIPQSTFEFFRTGSWCRSVAVGMGLDPDDTQVCGAGQDTGLPPGATAIPVHTYQTINHGVEVQRNALGANGQCNLCHNGSGNAANNLPANRRMNLSQLGYELREPATNTGLCNNCHGSESWPGFTSGHSEHRNRTVDGRPVTCNSCHINR